MKTGAETAKPSVNSPTIEAFPNFAITDRIPHWHAA
jgi:hypothetical protein